jgi:hypothetical protein
MPVSSTVQRGGQLSLAVTFSAGGNCGSEASINLDGVPFSSATLDGVAVTGSQVTITTSAAASSPHQVVFTISATAPLTCATSTPNADPNDFVPMIAGPWVVFSEGAGGNAQGGWTTLRPFVLEP